MAVEIEHVSVAIKEFVEAADEALLAMESEHRIVGDGERAEHDAVMGRYETAKRGVLKFATLIPGF